MRLGWAGVNGALLACPFFEATVDEQFIAAGWLPSSEEKGCPKPGQEHDSAQQSSL